MTSSDRRGRSPARTWRGTSHGDRLMRMVYLDEAGISNPQHEPYVVVAGPLIHADKTWKAVEEHLDAMADRYAPPDKRDEFVFHATDLFSGGKFFPRDKWEREARWKILDELTEIPRKFHLPLSVGWVERAKFAASFPHLDAAGQMVNAQTVAFAICAYGIELYMRKGGDIGKGEVASIVMENNDQARKQIKEFQRFSRNPKNADLLKSAGFGQMVLTRIIDTVHFAEKGHSSPLQIADVCAFVFKRHLMKAPESERFFAPLRDGFVLRDATDKKQTESLSPGFDVLMAAPRA